LLRWATVWPQYTWAEKWEGCYGGQRWHSLQYLYWKRLSTMQLFSWYRITPVLTDNEACGAARRYTTAPMNGTRWQLTGCSEPFSTLLFSGRASLRFLLLGDCGVRLAPPGSRTCCGQSCRLDGPLSGHTDIGRDTAEVEVALILYGSTCSSSLCCI